MLDKTEKLDQLQVDIDQCYECQEMVKGFAKPSGMDRGDIGRVVVVGQGPGNKEVEKGKAFAGGSGKKLDQWFVACGASEANPRKGIYFTSITKCVTTSKSQIKKMARNCRKFLNQQMEIIRPDLVITLGADAYEQYAFDGTPASEAWCRLFDSRDHLPLLSAEDHHFLLVWPHPSGLNRWHNDPENNKKLKETFPIVSRYLET